jgi:hypothetical protein
MGDGFSHVAQKHLRIGQPEYHEDILRCYAAVRDAQAVEMVQCPLEFVHKPGRIFLLQAAIVDVLLQRGQSLSVHDTIDALATIHQNTPILGHMIMTLLLQTLTNLHGVGQPLGSSVIVLEEFALAHDVEPYKLDIYGMLGASIPHHARGIKRDKQKPVVDGQRSLGGDPEVRHSDPSLEIVVEVSFIWHGAVPETAILCIAKQVTCSTPVAQDMHLEDVIKALYWRRPIGVDVCSRGGKAGWSGVVCEVHAWWWWVGRGGRVAWRRANLAGCSPLALRKAWLWWKERGE